MTSLTLPWPPSVNHYWRRVGARTLISKEGREYRERVAIERAAQRVKPLPGRVRVTIMCCLPDRRERDPDNLLKGLMDSMVHAGILAGDSFKHIQALTVEDSGAMEKGGKVMVRIEEAT